MPASKSTFNFERQKTSTQFAIAYFEKRNWKLLEIEFKTPMAAVDLLFYKDGTHLLVEVKAVSEMEMLKRFFRSRQFQRLQKARLWLENQKSWSTRFILYVFLSEVEQHVFDEEELLT